MKTLQATSELQADNQPFVAVPLTKEFCEKELHRLFNALETATEDTATTVKIIGTIADGIDADPEAAKTMFTPENVANVMLLKRKIDSGNFKPSDLEAAFPAITKFPIWAMVKTFIK